MGFFWRSNWVPETQGREGEGRKEVPGSGRKLIMLQCRYDVGERSGAEGGLYEVRSSLVCQGW